MQLFLRPAVATAALFGLAACGGSGGSGVSSAAAALNYDPVFASTTNPTIGTAIGSTGVTGVSVLSDRFGGNISFQSVNIRTTNGGSAVILTLNGQSYTLSEQSPGSFSNDDFLYILNFDEDDPVDEIFVNAFSQNNFGFLFGHVGVETALEDRPMGDARYVGSLTADLSATGGSLAGAQVTGTIYLTANFQDQVISGNWVLGLEDTGTPRGTITGSTTGNGILGTMTLAPESGYAGDLDMIGKLFGEDAETLAGVVGSENVTSISSGDTFIADGTFSLTNQTPP